MKPIETDIKQAPITVEIAHQFFNKRQMAFIVKMVKASYKEGFLNGMKIIPIFMLSISCLGQSSIVAAGKENFTIGETFPLMQQFDTIVQEGTLSVPKFEIPIDPPKPIVKKKLNFWQMILKLFNFK